MVCDVQSGRLIAPVADWLSVCTFGLALYLFLLPLLLHCVQLLPGVFGKGIIHGLSFELMIVARLVKILSEKAWRSSISS